MSIPLQDRVVSVGCSESMGACFWAGSIDQVSFWLLRRIGLRSSQSFLRCFAHILRSVGVKILRRSRNIFASAFYSFKGARPSSSAPRCRIDRAADRDIYFLVSCPLIDRGIAGDGLSPLIFQITNGQRQLVYNIQSSKIDYWGVWWCSQ